MKCFQTAKLSLRIKSNIKVYVNLFLNLLLL